MNIKRLLISLGAMAALLLTASVIGYADNNKDNQKDNQGGGGSRVQKGFEIAPVLLNLAKKDRALVGLGSYLVNAAGGCNDCHTNPSYTNAGNPYFLGVTAKQVPVGAYLAGGQTFGPFTSRNLTPDKTGKPAGVTFSEFKQIIRTGVDMDQWHLNLPAPLNGKVLQVMPWPTYGQLNDRDLSAIYEYLSAIPCLEGDPGNPQGADTKGARCH